MWLAVRFKLLKPLAFGVYKREMVCLHFNITDLVLGHVQDRLTMPWTARGQFCVYCTHYLSMGNQSRHLYTCFEGRCSMEKAKEALVLEQKNKASYFRKYALTGFEVKEILDEFVGKQLTTHG